MHIPHPLRQPWAITEAGLQLVLAVWSRGEAHADVLEKARERWAARTEKKRSELAQAREAVRKARIARAAAKRPKAKRAAAAALDSAQRELNALLARDGEPLTGTQSCTLHDGVAVIAVDGPLIRHASMFDDISGVSSYETIRKDFQAALDSDEVEAIVFDIDSPGGEVHGCAELSKAIYEARGTKPVIAYASGLMASAAYWIGSACDRVVVDSTAMLGSIGVRTAMVDDSRADEMAGYKVYDIVSLHAPYKVADAAKEEDRNRVRETMTSIEAVFIADVARNRNVTDAKVISGFGKGDVFIGADAVSAKLADSVGDLESLIASLKAEAETKPQGVFAMGKPAATIGDEKCDGCGRAMDEDDDTFCRACHADADASMAFQREIFALTGKTSKAEAIAVLTAQKQAAEEVATLRAAHAALEKTAAESAYEATVKEFRDAGIIPPAAEHKRSKYVSSLKGKPDAAAQVRAYCETLDPLVPAAPATEKQPEKPAGLASPAHVVNVAALSEDDKKMLAQLGKNPADLAKSLSASKSLPW